MYNRFLCFLLHAAHSGRVPRVLIVHMKKVLHVRGTRDLQLQISALQKLMRGVKEKEREKKRRQKNRDEPLNCEFDIIIIDSTIFERHTCDDLWRMCTHLIFISKITTSVPQTFQTEYIDHWPQSQSHVIMKS